MPYLDKLIKDVRDCYLAKLNKIVNNVLKYVNMLKMLV